MTASFHSPILTPHGHLLFAPDADAPVLPQALQDRLTQAFARGAGHGLLQLGAGEVGVALPLALGYWRDFAARYVTALCATPVITEGSETSMDEVAILEVFPNGIGTVSGKIIERTRSWLGALS